MKNLSPSAIIRSQARQTLKGNYVAAVSAFVILLLPVYIIIGLSTAIECLLLVGIDDEVVLGMMKIIFMTPLTIITFVFLSPLFNGYIRLFYNAALTKEFHVGEMFYYFEGGRYARTLHLNLAYIIRMALPSILCFLPLFVYQMICFGYMSDFVGTVLYNDFAFILTVLSSILLILYSLKYFLVFTLYCTNEQADNKEIFRSSKEIMQEQKHSATQLIFSFTPWLLLCLLILPALYVIPYLTMSLCIGRKWMTMKGK